MTLGSIDKYSLGDTMIAADLEGYIIYQCAFFLLSLQLNKLLLLYLNTH